jgi:hypothetical protein
VKEIRSLRNAGSEERKVLGGTLLKAEKPRITPITRIKKASRNGEKGAGEWGKLNGEAGATGEQEKS